MDSETDGNNNGTDKLSVSATTQAEIPSLEMIHDLIVKAGQNNDWAEVRKILEDDFVGDDEKMLNNKVFTMTCSCQGLTALSLACMKNPPPDVVEKLVAASNSKARTITDNNGDTPLHLYLFWNATRNESISMEVIKMLATSDVLNIQNRFGCTPLFIAIRDWYASSAELLVEIIDLLLPSSSQSSSREDILNLPDEHGRTVLHIAVQKGLSLSIIRQLVTSEAIVKRDNNNSTPIYYAYRFDGEEDHEINNNYVTIELLQILLPDSLVKSEVFTDDNNSNVDDDVEKIGSLLVRRLGRWYDEDLYDSDKLNIQDKAEFQTVEFFLCAEPRVSPDFFQELHLLNYDLLLRLVAFPHVKEMFNIKFCEPHLMGLVCLEVFVRCCITTAFTLLVWIRLEPRFISDAEAHHPTALYIVMGYSLTFLACREYLQYDLIQRNKCQHYFADKWNWTDIGFIILVLISTIFLGLDDDMFKDTIRILFMITGAAVWIHIIFFLRSLKLQFAVFVEALVHTMWILLPFIITTFLCLGAFAIVYYIDALSNHNCPPDDDASSRLNFCSFQDSLLLVYVLFVGGGPGEDEFSSALSTLIITIVFAFVAVILLLNVVIAVVTDSWSAVNEMSQEIFWMNRLSFICEISGVRENMLKRAFFLMSPTKSEVANPNKRGAKHYSMFGNCVILVLAVVLSPLVALFSIFYWFTKQSYLKKNVIDWLFCEPTGKPVITMS